MSATPFPWQVIACDHSEVRKCYEHEQGATIGSWIEEEVRPYVLWCGEKVQEWKVRTDALGYVWPCWCIGTVGMTQTYHEWLKERVGL